MIYQVYDMIVNIFTKYEGSDDDICVIKYIQYSSDVNIRLIENDAVFGRIHITYICVIYIALYLIMRNVYLCVN